MVLAIDITIDDKVSAKLLKLSQGKLKTKLGEKLLDVATFLQIRALHYAYENAQYSRTGKLASSIRISQLNTKAGTATVIADRRVAPYALAVETGQSLNAKHGNNPAWGRRTNNGPGVQGKHFMARAAVDGQFIAPRKVSEGIRLAIRESGLKIK